jgi:hypothetical protein
MNDSAHWLEGVLLKAGKTAGGAAALPNSLSLAEAWEKASSATGIHQNELADLVAAFFHLPRAELLEVEGKALKLVPEALAKKYHLLPLHEDYRRLVVATADPTNLEAEQSLGFASGRGISLVVASYSEIETASLSHYSLDKDVARILFRFGLGWIPPWTIFGLLKMRMTRRPLWKRLGRDPWSISPT